MAQESRESKADDEQIDQVAHEFAHPKHAHTLKLLELHPDHEESLCNICFQSCKEYNSIYSCEICKFRTHVSCARGTEERKLIQGCHNQRHHSLIHQKRRATFQCDACGKEDNEPSYLCTECKLWIHQSCADLNGEISHRDHEHKLSLEFFLPERFRSFKLSCDVCGEKLHFAYWFYYCGRCSFFVHVKCAGKNRRVAEDNIETYPKLNLALLPEAKESVQLIVRFLEQNGILGNPNPSLIENFHHKMHHSLVLSKNTHKGELVCDGCIGTIVDQCYYGCQHSECSYFLHETCSQLPSELELYHPFHPEHPLYLRHPEYCYSLQQCSHCKLDTNGWWFECRKSNCQFRLDMKCSLLPKAIAHKSHRHPLSRISASNTDCSACGKRPSGSSYGCEACGFYIGNDCALLPPTATHKWDEHPLSLIFLPFIYHQDEILCEICETFAHPKYWLYHCEKCDQFFHPHCIPGHGSSRNIKFGSTILQIGEHSMQLVEKGKYKSHCGVCRNPKRLDQENAMLCITCNLHICRECAGDILEEKNTKSIAKIPPCNKTLENP